MPLTCCLQLVLQVSAQIPNLMGTCSVLHAFAQLSSNQVVQNCFKCSHVDGVQQYTSKRNNSETPVKALPAINMPDA